MYNVSEEYLKAIAKPVRTWKIRVDFGFSDGTHKVFDDSTIIGDPMIESQAVSGSSSCGVIDIGAVPCATASLTVIDKGTTLKKYAEAEFTMWVSLLLESGKYEDVLMGTFYCDTSKMSRLDDKISVYAYDAMSSLNYTLTEAQRDQLNGCTAYQVVTALIRNAKCNFVQSLSSFPNADQKLDLTNTQVRTARDCIMWCAQLMGCFARVNRQNYLEFVPIRSIWEFYDDEHTLGTIIAVRNIGDRERYKTTFSDDRIHIIGVSMSDDNNNPVTVRKKVENDDSNVEIALERNPLFMSSEYSLITTLSNILAPLSTTYFYAFDAEIRSDPALDAGDTVRLKGGLINGTNQNSDLIGFITHNVWRYRSKHEIINTGQTPVPSTNEVSFEAPRSQLEKKIDAMSGGGASDRIVSAKGTKLIVADSFSVDEDYKQINVIASSDRVSFYVKRKNGSTCELMLHENVLRYNIYKPETGSQYFIIEPQKSDSIPTGGLIDLNGQTLEMKSGNLYFNGKKVLME